ncbi:serine hydrolase [Altererythrobacter arenosus]|uniref:Serine hydrolase n=1 Tax=Altererythrobacter arenosus TaxID=3032592 RepID=A0ABY8FQU3_9SPHN|nr:serine hydrolase [Altererythrobacter sp. CAU 1644]WFL77222.1 serine hydrolase [Altererythrobacter sp. CAU 1644]
MRLKFALLAGALALSGCSMTSYTDAEVASVPVSASVEMVTPPERDPSELQVLFWTDEQRSARFREMENWFAGHEVPASPAPRALPQGEPLDAALASEIKALMASTNASGVMVLQDGKKRFEQYGLGLGPQDRWTSFSVAKSFTSTLLGAAVRDGFITSLDDPVTKYVPQLTGSAYDGVTVRQIATMTSGVAWNEDYADPDSDVAKMQEYINAYGADAIFAQMKTLKREAPAGEKWLYKTVETNLIGIVVENAVGLPLAKYAKSKIADAAGFEGDMFWMTDPRGGSIGGCCLSIRLADYARMGQFALEGGGDVVPEGWFVDAGDSLVDFGDSGFGYGYQWWTYPGGNWGAQGIFGQAITIVPSRNMVVAIVSNWPTASNNDNRALWRNLIEKIAAAD